MQSPGFYYALQPYPYALDCAEQLSAEFEVYLCTSPHELCFAECLCEKALWITEHMGPHWLSKTIFSVDKTLVDAACLIDDKPQTIGANPRPGWQRVVFNQPYNQETPGTRLCRWQDLELSSLLTPQHPCSAC